VKYPSGGYVRVVPCAVKLKQPHTITASFQGNEVVVLVDGKEKVRFRDDLKPLSKGHVGVGVGSGAKVAIEGITITALPNREPAPARAHVADFAVRNWLGGRSWVFDGDEPILQLPVPESNPFLNVKLRPGYRPMLTWNSHWDIQNQGAYPE